jgi:hypothetical protein
MRLRILGITLAILVGAYSILTIGLPAYDRRTKAELTSLVARELSSASGEDAMEAFMRRHTDRYGLDDFFDFEYAGIRKQTEVDKLLFHRKVQIALRYDPVTKLYIGCRITVFYTFL